MASRHNRHKGLLDLGPNYTRSGIKYAWVSPSPTLTTCPGSIAGLRVSPSPGSHGLVCSLTAKQILLGSGRTGSACHGQKPVSSRPMLRRASSAPLQGRSSSCDDHRGRRQMSSRSPASHSFQLDAMASSRAEDLTNKISVSELLYGHSMYLRPISGAQHRSVSSPGSSVLASNRRAHLSKSLMAPGPSRPSSAGRYPCRAEGPAGRLENKAELSTLRGTHVGSSVLKPGGVSTVRPGTPAICRQQRPIAAQWSADVEASSQGPRRGSSPYPQSRKSHQVAVESGGVQSLTGTLTAVRLGGRAAKVRGGAVSATSPPFVEQRRASHAGCAGAGHLSSSHAKASKGRSRSCDALSVTRKVTGSRASSRSHKRDCSKVTGSDLEGCPGMARLKNDKQKMESGLMLGLRQALAAVESSGEVSSEKKGGPLSQTADAVLEQENAMCGALDWEACEGMQALRRLAPLPIRRGRKPVRVWPALPEPWAPYCMDVCAPMDNTCSDLMRECHALTCMVGLNDAWLDALSSWSTDEEGADEWSEC